MTNYQNRARLDSAGIFTAGTMISTVDKPAHAASSRPPVRPLQELSTAFAKLLHTRPREPKEDEPFVAALIAARAAHPQRERALAPGNRLRWHRR